ncbi:hypothetical protein KXR53_16445 [Inquilinus limosus]|uniref:hypothetical protein n=1 Tax=Inquilinus limosus TaxID=171674 RepID=UPI003F1705CF
MRNALIGPAFLAGLGPAAAGEIASAYTDLDLERDCATVAAAGPDDGGWQDLVCSVNDLSGCTIRGMSG